MTKAVAKTVASALMDLVPAPEVHCREVADGDWRVLVTGRAAYSAAEIQNFATAHGVLVHTNRAEFS